MNGQLRAGTTRGVCVIDDAGATQTLEARHVRDLVNLDDRVLAGAAGGLYLISRAATCGRFAPRPVGGVLVGTDTGEVWQVSEDAQWIELGSGLPLVWSLAVV